MQIKQLREFIDIMSPYLDMDSFVEANYEQIYFEYSGILPEPIYNYLHELGCASIGENYQYYVENRDEFEDYLTFYV